MMMFAAHVQPGDFCRRFMGDKSCTVGGALQRFVVHQNRHTIGGQRDIKFHAPAAHACCNVQPGQGIFRRQRTATAMRDDAWVRDGL